MPHTVRCPDPDCQAPAAIIDRWTWPSTDGPIEHARTRCLAHHVFTPAADYLTPYTAPERELVTSG